MKLTFRLLFVAALITLALFFGNKIMELNDLAKFGVFLLVGAALGLMAVQWWLPQLADTVVQFLFSWNNEQIHQTEEPASLVTSMLAKGEYREAIVECERQLAKTPMQPFLIAEMAKIYLERLDEPAKAMELLEEQLAHHNWAVDDEAYLRFLQVDVLLQKGDTELGVQKLTQISKLYPESKHAGKALHLLRELRQKQVPPMSHVSVNQA